MPLVPHDFPSRLAARGLHVNVFGGWESHGGSADHRAVVLHHTASGSSTRPEDDAAYCHHGSSDSPLYNVLIDRVGCAWVLAREKSNSSGSINSTACNEALQGRAGNVNASARGLQDDGSNNDALFSIAAQNDGVGEPWSDALLNGMAIASAVALECLGLAHAGFVTEHRVLTSRKVDCCGANYPTTAMQARITDVLGGRGYVEEEEEPMPCFITTQGPGEGPWWLFDGFTRRPVGIGENQTLVDLGLVKPGPDGRPYVKVLAPEYLASIPVNDEYPGYDNE